MKRRIIKHSHKVGFKPIKTFEGETIERKCARLVENNEPISDGAPLVYFDKKDGVRPETNIRTDKWAIAQEAMNRVTKEKLAKGIHTDTQGEPNPNKSGDGREGEPSQTAGQTSSPTQ